MNDSDRIKAPGVPVEIRPDLRAYIKFNMLSSLALEHTYGTSSPLQVLLSMTPTTATDTLAFLLGAGMLHEANAIGDADEKLVADLDGIDGGTVIAEDEAKRLGRRLMRLYDGETMDSAKLIHAVVKASDISRPLDPCSRCDHRLGDHGWFEPCEIEGCSCEGYTRACAECKHHLTEHDAESGVCKVKGCRCGSKADAGKAEALASTGAGSTTPSPSDLVAASASSGA